MSIYASHYDYLHEHLETFWQRVTGKTLDESGCAGIIGTHGDKAYGYRISNSTRVPSMTVFSIVAAYDPSDMEQGAFASTFEAESIAQAEHLCRLRMMANSSSFFLDGVPNEEYEQIMSVNSIDELALLDFLDESDVASLTSHYKRVEIMEIVEGVNIWAAKELYDALKAMVAAVDKGPEAIAKAKALSEKAFARAEEATGD